MSQRCRRLVLAAVVLLSCGASVAVVSAANCTVHPLAVSDVIKLSQLIRDRMYCYNNVTDEDGVRYHALIAGCVRLAFHASIDPLRRGCINLNDGRQAGLRLAVVELEQLYAQSQSDPYYAKISRADFWVLAGITAIEIATRDVFSATFHYGRCDDCVGSYDTSAALNLPDQLFSGQQVVDYLYGTFRLNPYEAIALMGAHSLGVVTDPGRGVRYGKWVLNPENLSGGYFADMIDESLKWKQVPRQFTLENRTAWSWTHGSDNKRVYLNCDMGLYISLNDTGNGQSACGFTDCPLSRFYNVIFAYVRFPAYFSFYFQRAFQKMIDYGSTGLLTPS